MTALGLLLVIPLVAFILVALHPLRRDERSTPGFPGDARHKRR